MEKQSRPIALSRSVVLTEESSIPSLLLLGKLVSDGFPAASASVLPDKLREIWDPSGTVNFWPVTDGTFLVQFYEAEDLTKAHEGAPWSCGDGDEGLFFMQHVKQGMNMVDQIAGFTKAELWVRFNSVPVDHFSATSVYALAAGIGEPVNCDLSHTSSADFLRARIRVDIMRPLKCSVDVVLENGHQASVSVEYEGVLPSLCSSCRILGHPADRCPRRAHQPAAAAPTAAASRPAVYTPTPSHLGPGRSTSSLRGKSSRRYEVVFANEPTSPAPPPTPSALRRSGQEPLSPVNSSCFNFFKLKSWRKGVGKNKSFSTVDDSQHEIEPSNQEAQYCLIFYDCYSFSGLDAAYDGKRGVISIYGLQIDQNTDPVDLVAYLLPKIRTKSGLEETQTKPDSPARFADTMMRFHDAHCCKGASKESRKNGI
ncbi:hypothetical protein QYE76_059038 [Lolium multiflorum]|uniref:DUF4283 domain-containing protein n=1 Tax=Lolium multiflorum TaxID=4521 RepID=A0AAD8T7E2_LOLMU|nr:hypothetical protein QYE76_059038 [Lolium multiflorum]